MDHAPKSPVMDPLPDAGVSREFDASFPLTPKERKPGPLRRADRPVTYLPRQNSLLPLPKGEGWGGRKGSARRPRVRVWFEAWMLISKRIPNLLMAVCF